MRLRRFSAAGLVTLGVIQSAPLAAQGGTIEIAELHQRVASIRAHLPDISRVAERSALFLGHESTSRLLIPRQLDPAFYLEFVARAGGPPDTRDTDEPDVPGLVLLPIRHWIGVGLGVAGAVSRWQSMQRPVIIIGPANGRPSVAASWAFVDDGAPAGDRESGPINGIANMVAGWTLYAEVIAAATGAGWQPGVLLSVLAPGAASHNAGTQFRVSVETPPPLVPPGQLGAAYLDAVDSTLEFAATPMHQATVDSIGERLRRSRAAGRKLFVASCGHYLAEELLRDSVDSPFIPIDARRDASAEFARHGATPRDLVLWFGYVGYDCPNADVAATFRARGLDVILVTSEPPVPTPDEIVAEIPLRWRIPDAVAAIPFAPGSAAPISSVEMALHYLWLRHLVATKKQ